MTASAVSQTPVEDAASNFSALATPSYQMFASRVRYIPGLGAVYFINPKVACSVVLASMWIAHDQNTGITTFKGDAHAAQPNPFIASTAELQGKQLDQFLELPFFSVVRNPYARFVSAYLDKVVRGRGTPDWENVRRSIGLPTDPLPTFSAFLDAVTKADPARLDWHFCPQNLNLLSSIVDLDFIGRLETFSAVEGFLEKRGIAVQSRMPHANHPTHADTRIREFIGPREAELIRRYYERDFVLYGYSDDPAQLAAVAAPVRTENSRGDLGNILRGYQQTPSVAIPPAKPTLREELKDHIAVSTAPFARTVQLAIMPGDKAFVGEPIHYFSCGASALDSILTSLQSSGGASPRTILDFNAGAGRIGRWLRAAFPLAEIDARCLREQDAAFIRAHLNANAWVPSSHLDQSGPARPYDLIWLDSILTTLSGEATTKLLDTMRSWTAPGGVVVAGTLGRRAIELRELGVQKYVDDESWALVENGYRNVGYGFTQIASGSGLSITKMSWIADQIQDLENCRLVSMVERSWDDYIDLFAFQRLS